MVSSFGSSVDIGDIARVALRWTAAVAAADLRELSQLMTDDIVVTHGNGRTLSGRDTVLADFAQALQQHQIEQEIVSEETVVTDSWAFDRARVHMTIFVRDTGDRRDFDSRTLTILRKEASHGWCVARAIGVIEQVA
jgi:uncharacterized protein (TIGR02246 family)